MHLAIVYSTSTGHTEHVIGALQDSLARKAPDLTVTAKRAEQADAEDLLSGDALLLACGTWNTGGSEGQLHMYMDELLKKRANDVDLRGKPCAIIALGDDRYYYSCRATEHLMQFIMLLIVNEPFGQEEKVQKWGEKLAELLCVPRCLPVT